MSRPPEGYGLQPASVSKQQASFVTGHDFSRAEKPTKRNWALAPEGSKNMEMHTALRIKITEKTRS
jgi:hypothetical protein